MVSKGVTALLILSTALQGLAQSQARIPVTGAPVSQQPGVGAPLRRSINDLQAAGGPQWDLYILALSSLQLDNDEQELSYFQIEGIHGVPFIEWNGAGPRVNGNWGGYCPHNENIFLSWHRAYVALFEQTLVARAKQLALMYPPNLRAQYVQAAESLRQPYWDWASDPRVPPSTVSPSVTVVHPSGGQRVNIENPLYSFRIPPAVLNGKYGTFDAQRRPQTLRCPAPNSYPASANALMSQRPYRQWMYDVLTRARDFTEFSLGGNITSLEQIHNAVHWDAGCAGMFLDTGVTAFDPLFMLHHSFVDRIWAFWQALRPDQDVFSTPYAARARFSTAAGTAIDFNSPLQPFFHRSGAFHTTLSVRAIWEFGYGYEGLEWWAKSADQMRQDVINIVNRLYSTGRPASGAKRRSEEATTRYFATVSLDIAQVERPCQVVVYVDGTRAGSLVIMNRPQSGVVRTGFGLDGVGEDAMQAIVDGKAGGSANSSVEVEIVKPDGSRVPLNKVTSLKVEVQAVGMTPALSLDQLPEYGSSRRHKVHVSEVKAEKH
ncbi:tyrosinase [Hirsutella rhossiliensis]|uniref:tyrosinase n=1 Tax=Hirsutella rhossiliensis TaxID=111463 RepID=A0A9P8N5G2_9HYPO|nr:tyrosinase [Hirsutella rhossiliensis]KAH0966104.1 tyrosinase [Hirsutella rhossiliensis]